MKHLILAGMCVALCTIVVLADTLKLKDGSKLEGRVIPQGDKYWIKTADGQTRTIPKDQVLSYEKSAPGAPIAPAAPAPKPAADASMKATPIPITSSFATVKSKADKAESPILAVSLWEKFIESNPSADELAAAKVELVKWQQLEKDKAEKINGKWIGGDEKKKLLKQVDQL